MTQTKHTIDATDQSMGRLASKVALLLRGKNNPTFQHYIMPTEKVEVINIRKLKFTGSKIKNKVYYRYSGHPGGIYKKTLAERFEKEPVKLFRKVVLDMLPKNRLASKIIKNLEVK